jgi:hypothetical protein
MVKMKSLNLPILKDSELSCNVRWKYECNALEKIRKENSRKKAPTFWDVTPCNLEGAER